MHFSADNLPLGIVEEASRRREQYARHVEKRAAVLIENPATHRRIERHARKVARARIADAATNCARIYWQARALLAPEDR